MCGRFDDTNRPTTILKAVWWTTGITKAGPDKTSFSNTEAIAPLSPYQRIPTVPVCRFPIYQAQDLGKDLISPLGNR